ncbi:unnamed protein product, partial [Ectocarpus sp. 13 AM-2016]
MNVSVRLQAVKKPTTPTSCMVPACEKKARVSIRVGVVRASLCSPTNIQPRVVPVETQLFGFLFRRRMYYSQQCKCWRRRGQAQQYAFQCRAVLAAWFYDLAKTDVCSRRYAAPVCGYKRRIEQWKQRQKHLQGFGKKTQGQHVRRPCSWWAALSSLSSVRQQQRQASKRNRQRHVGGDRSAKR